jgi:uncharacterized protein YjbI with pentapeptide repeats
MTLFTCEEVLNRIKEKKVFYQKVNLTNTSLITANLEGATFTEINFQGTILQDANLEKTIWQNIKFIDCNVDNAVFTNAKGLTLEQKQWLRKNGALNVPQ